METIFQRRSIRKYTDTPVTDQQLEQLLRAGMAAPTSSNDQEWVFIVLQNRDTMHRIVEIDSYARALETAPLCIVVCADMQRVSEPEDLYWVQDLSAAAQNMLLEATDLGLGSLWMGLSPQQRAELQTILQLPEHVNPLMILAFGTAAVQKSPIDRWLADRVWFERYEEHSDH